MSASPKLPWIERAALTAVAQQPSRFRRVSSGIVVEAERGLMWSAQGLDRSLSWDEARLELAASRLGGYSDWRLPTIEELLGLIDWQRHDPAIDQNHFDAQSTWYWTATAVAGVADYRWFVDFGRGLTDFHPKSTAAMVRGVRYSG